MGHWPAVVGQAGSSGHQDGGQNWSPLTPRRCGADMAWWSSARCRSCRGSRAPSWSKRPRPSSRSSALALVWERITQISPMHQALAGYMERAAEKLREGMCCRHVTLFIRASPFSDREPYYGNQVSTKLAMPT